MSWGELLFAAILPPLLAAVPAALALRLLSELLPPAGLPATIGMASVLVHAAAYLINPAAEMERRASWTAAHRLTHRLKPPARRLAAWFN
ncbi:MAG: hypothetical protein ACYDAG_18150 [Chloroflexota bacterium]